jgi:hypothetical protein
MPKTSGIRTPCDWANEYDFSLRAIRLPRSGWLYGAMCALTRRAANTCWRNDGVSAASWAASLAFSSRSLLIVSSRHATCRSARARRRSQVIGESGRRDIVVEV